MFNCFWNDFHLDVLKYTGRTSFRNKSWSRIAKDIPSDCQDIADEWWPRPSINLSCSGNLNAFSCTSQLLGMSKMLSISHSGISSNPTHMAFSRLRSNKSSFWWLSTFAITALLVAIIKSAKTSCPFGCTKGNQQKADVATHTLHWSYVNDVNSLW